MKTILLSAFLSIFLLLLACTQKKEMPETATPPATTTPASFLLYKNFPSKITTPRNVEIWLPEEYDQTTALPVLYMFDGQNIFHGISGWSGEFNRGWEVDETLDSLIKAKVIPPIIVVGIFNIREKRGTEYMPAKPKDLLSRRIEETDNEWYRSFKETPPESDEQLKFIVEELKPFIDANYKTKKDRENTFIGGSSMGGLISAYAICEYPEVFGRAACFSTHWVPFDGYFLEYIKEKLPDPATHKIYFDYGTEGLDGEYEPFQLIADKAMQDRGFEKNKNWMTLKFDGAKHHEDDWRKRFHIPLEFLLRK
ncbi:MAG: alpha/beta hydrolase-fold protein [Bacteroidota bacterium]